MLFTTAKKDREEQEQRKKNLSFITDYLRRLCDSIIKLVEKVLCSLPNDHFRVLILKYKITRLF